MYRRQGYMIRDMERKCVTTDKFWKVHGKVDQVLHETTNVIQVHPTTTTSTKTTTSADLQQQLYLKMKSNLQDQANDLALLDVLKHKNRMHGKRKQLLMKMRMKATLNDMLNNQFRNAKEYAYHLEQVTNFMENQIVWEIRKEDIRRPIPKPLIFYGPQRNPKNLKEANLEEKMNRWVHKEFKNFNKDARLSIQHWKDSRHKRVYKQNQTKFKDNPKDYFSNHKITKVVRITTDQLCGLDFMEQIIVMRENDKPDSFSEANFKYLNRNDIEDVYYLYRNKKLGIESYQIKVNLTAPTLKFPGIEAHDPYSIVDKPTTGLIYLNNKDEKRAMYLVEIVKFCDVTLEKVINELKLRIFHNQF
ncbi:hypothetical protein Tco_1272375 [Tanacetum coccineum]